MQLNDVKIVSVKSKRNTLKDGEKKLVCKKKNKLAKKKKSTKKPRPKTQSYLSNSIITKSDFDTFYIKSLLSKSQSKNLLNQCNSIPKQWKKFYSKFFGHCISNKVF